MATDRRRIGITMRDTCAAGYHEPRDALARDWASLMAAALPEAAWMPVPNLGEDAVEFCRRWQLDGLILSGGEDIGTSPARDSTEKALVRHFIAAGQPILGVCRGLQLLWDHYGGTLAPVAGHVATRHRVTLVASEWQQRLGRSEIDVNSFHANGLSGPPPRGFEPLAIADDGGIEAIHHASARLLGVMWHPERERPARDFDLAITRRLFGGGDIP